MHHFVANPSKLSGGEDGVYDEMVQEPIVNNTFKQLEGNDSREIAL